MGLDYSLILTHEYAAFDIKRPIELQDKIKSSLRTPFVEDIGNLCYIGLDLEESKYVSQMEHTHIRFSSLHLTHCDQTTKQNSLGRSWICPDCVKA